MATIQSTGNLIRRNPTTGSAIPRGQSQNTNTGLSTNGDDVVFARNNKTGRTANIGPSLAKSINQGKESNWSPINPGTSEYKYDYQNSYLNPKGTPDALADPSLTSAPINGIDTSQPSPQNVSVNTPGAPLGNSPSLSPAPIQPPAPTPMNPQRQGLAAANASGTQAPATQGEANVSSYIPSKPGINPINDQLAQDEGYQQLLSDRATYMQTVNQRDSLTQEYTNLSKQLGIKSLDTQLMDAKNVIDGSEDDIRNEITKAGGFGTDSQVTALANARNKVLIKNYNNLLETRNNAQQTLTTMIGLASQDRQAADQAFNMQMNFDQQINNYRDKAITNSQDVIKTMQQSEGWDNIYKAAIASGDPSAISRINQTMGPGFDLASVAAQAAKDRSNADTMTALDIKGRQVNIAQGQASIANSAIDRKIKQLQLNEANGLPNPAKANTFGYNDQGIKYNLQSAAQEASNLIKSQGLTGADGKLSPSDYNRLQSSWVSETGLSGSDFQSIFGGLRNQNIIKQYN